MGKKMEKSSNKSPVTMEKPDDLTLEQCQEAFAMFRQKPDDLTLKQCQEAFAMFRQKPDDLTVDQCQEAFAMFRLHTAKVNQAQKVQQCLFLIMRSQGLCHIREQIFGYLSYETLENCHKVSKLWKESLEKIALIKFLEEFGDREVGPTNEKLSTILPGWKNAAQKYGFQASMDDIEEVKDSLKKLAEGKGKCVQYPVHQEAENGDVKLMEFILKTSFDMNTKDGEGWTAWHFACCNGQTETAQLIIQNSKEFGIDLNSKAYSGITAWHSACCNGKTETVQLIIQNSKLFDIDLNAKDNDGETAWHWACFNDQTETAQFIMQNSKEFSINLNAK